MTWPLRRTCRLVYVTIRDRQGGLFEEHLLDSCLGVSPLTAKEIITVISFEQIGVIVSARALDLVPSNSVCPTFT